MTATYDPHPDRSREDAERAVETQRPQLETAVELTHEVWGWCEDHTHASVTEWDACEAAYVSYLDAEAKAERDAEAAVERYFEDRGYWEARAQEDLEALRGIGVDVEWLLVD